MGMMGSLALGMLVYCNDSLITCSMQKAFMIFPGLALLRNSLLCKWCILL